MCLIIILHIAHTLFIFRFAGLCSPRWSLSLCTSIDNGLNLLYIDLLFIHTTALLIELQSLHMSALCHVILCLYYSALISLYPSLSQVPVPSDFKTCLLEHLYNKDCITTRQSWLFYFYIFANNKQDEMKLENIYSKLQSSFVLLQFVHLFILHYTTL